ncbi:MAG: diguanylate cyclase [Nitrospirae bacterium]|nr:MAG: diguanylate cyclase [Nitrospirota bacterium]
MTEQDRYKKMDISVLYVEDEPAAREKTARMLKREVRTIYLAEDGVEGLEIFKRHNPDIVITDIKMPRMDGLDMTRAIKEINKLTPVIVTTAHDDTAFFLKSIEIGIDRYVLKPIDQSLLTETLVEFAETIRRTEELRQKNKLLEEYKRAVDVSSILCKTDTGWRITYANDAFCGISGFTCAELTGKEYLFVIKHDKQEIMLRDMRSNLESNNIWKGIIEHRRKDDTSCFIDLTALPILDADDKVVEFIYIGNDVTELIDLNSRLKKLSDTDTLTQAYNRMAFNNIIETEMQRAKRYKTPLSLILFDIDNFKKINDNFGHLAGDEALKRLACIVSATIRNVDILVRWGGEEFVVIAPETNLSAANEAAERLREAIEGSDFDGIGSVTSSFGVSQFREDDHPGALIKRADEALYKAKEKGKNRVELEQ